jgi:hypothetical protein
MSDYRYDDDVLEEVANRLYAAIPAMYRVPDEAGRGDLKRLLEVLAVPLAVLHQSIEELHADLFVDTADDRIVPYLAEMVGTGLVFPDAESNRRDVRGTVGWRRRKGTPVALEEMGGELTAQSVVLEEGWKRIQLAQDLNLVRPERTVVDVRPRVVAEQASGPLDSLFHAVDIRSITARSGRYHPRHVAHWLQPTTTFPLRETTAVERSVDDSDIRYAIDPLGVRRPLRARRAAGDREPFVDRILEQHFAATPERWFDRSGGFTVRICGLAAGIAGAELADRVADVRAAGRELVRNDVTLTPLELPAQGWRGTVRVELGLASVLNPAAGTWRPNPSVFDPRASIDLDAAGVVASSSATGSLPTGLRVPLVRLSAPDGTSGRIFPGATLELASSAPGSTAAVEDSALAREGFLRGVVHVRIPRLHIRGERFLLIAIDGSLYDVEQPGGAAIDMPDVGGDRQLAPAALISAGPGAAWPPLPPRAEPLFLNRVPAAPGRGPAVMHGALPLRRVGGDLVEIAATAQCTLVFAAQLTRPGGPEFRPFQRLDWTGPDARSGTWTAVDELGLPAGSAAAEFAEVADARDKDPDAIALAVRFECSAAGSTLCPGEVAWTTDDGRTVLVHLPQLDAEPVPADAAWPAPPAFGFASEAVRVADDGSTWASESTAGRRVSLGDVAPIAEAAGLRRRRVRWRRLCAWDHEDWTASPPETLALTQPGRLDVDPLHGLFALSADEPPQQWPAGPDGAVPPNVTTDHEEGATMHIGARPAAREPVLDIRLTRPTRLVSRSGTLHPDAPADWHTIPRYESLDAALAAVAARWAALTAGDPTDVSEVVQFEDSATYPAEAPTWPDGPTDPAARAAARLSLTIQSAERERPTVLVDPTQGWLLPAPAPRYSSVTLRGIALGGEGWTGMTLPPADGVAIELCSLLEPENELELSDVPDGVDATIKRCETAGLVLAGAGVLSVSDSIVDAGPGVAVRAPACRRVALDRVSVGGEVRVRVLDASEVIFDDGVTVDDRFHGCVRYSRAPAASTLPRVHRVTFDTPVRLVSRNRRDDAWWRLREDCPAAIVRGAESGSEMGAFSLTHLAERRAGFERRLAEFTPAGLVTGIIRID